MRHTCELWKERVTMSCVSNHIPYNTVGTITYPFRRYPPLATKSSYNQARKLTFAFHWCSITSIITGLSATHNDHFTADRRWCVVVSVARHVQSIAPLDPSHLRCCNYDSILVTIKHNCIALPKYQTSERHKCLLLLQQNCRPTCKMSHRSLCSR